MSIFRIFLSILLSGVLLLTSFGVAAKDYPDQGSAYSGCMADGAKASKDSSRWATGNYKCALSSATRYTCSYEARVFSSTYTPYYIVCGNFAGAETYHDFPASSSCKARPDSINNPPDYVGWFTSGAVNGTMSCVNGCVGITVSSGDTILTSFSAGAVCSGTVSKEQCDAMGSGYYYNSAMGTCVPKKEECTSGQKMENGKCVDTCPSGMTLQADGSCENEKNTCPAGQIKSPAGNCLPGEGQCAAGEALGKDGTCKKDSDGDGKPDDDADDQKSFSGGDNCDSPPSCAGDAILCGQARIQWRIDCNTRRQVDISGGSCDAVPLCVGKNCQAMEYAQLLQQWKTACAVAALAAKTDSGSSGDSADVKAIKDALTADGGTPDLGDAGDPAGAFSDESGYSDGLPDGKLDTSGFGYGGSCPQIPAVTVFGQTLNFNTGPFCSWMLLGGKIVLVMAALMSLRIISSSGES